MTPFSLRLRLEEGETRTSHTGRQLITLKFSVVQQPEFGPIWDTMVNDPDSSYAQDKINELTHAMRIPLEPRWALTTQDLVDRFLAKRRYVLALITEYKSPSGEVRPQIKRYYRIGD